MRPRHHFLHNIEPPPDYEAAPAAVLRPQIVENEKILQCLHIAG